MLSYQIDKNKAYCLSELVIILQYICMACMALAYPAFPSYKPFLENQFWAFAFGTYSLMAIDIYLNKKKK